MKSILLIAALVATATLIRAQTIGVSNGVSWVLMGSTTVIKPDAGNCPAIPNQGVYRRETRHYTEYVDGHVLREWTDTVDVFVDCREL